MKHFDGSIQKKDIEDYLKHPGVSNNKKEAILALQELKNTIVSNIFSVFSLLNPHDYKKAESKYLDGLSESQIIDEYFDDNYLNEFKYLIENAFKKRNGNKENLPPLYISYEKFSKLSYYIEKYGDFDRITLGNLCRDNKLSIEERFEINEFLNFLKLKQTNKSLNKNIYFDQKQFRYYEVMSGDHYNYKCFYELDASGNKHFFSINDLLNDLVTFGFEVGLPYIDTKLIPKENKKFFLSLNRKFKYALALSMLQNIRDKQERIMYSITDFEKYSCYGNYKGRLTELIVERYFRSISQKFKDFSISVVRSSPGNDAFGKKDLELFIENKKKGISVKKALQLTMHTNESVLTTKRRKIKNSHTKLLRVEIIALKRIIFLWRKFNRPIGGIGDLLTIQDKVFLGQVLQDIITEILNESNTNKII